MEDVGAGELDERAELTSDDRAFCVVAFGENVVVATVAMDGLFPPNAVPNADPNADPEGLSFVSEDNAAPDGNAEPVLVFKLKAVFVGAELNPDVGAELNPDVGANAVVAAEVLKTEPVGPAELNCDPV